MSIVHEPPVLNQRSSPEDTLWDAVVSFNTSASARVRVFARTEEEAKELMTDRYTLYQSDPEFQMDETYVEEFFANNIQPVTEEDS